MHLDLYSSLVPCHSFSTSPSISFCPLLGVLPSSAPIFSFPSSPADCVEAHRVCSADPRCEALYRGLELCAAEAAVSLLGEQVAAECLERQDALLSNHPVLSSCKCQRGFRREEQCLRIYWRVRLLPGQSGLSWGWDVEDMHAYIKLGLPLSIDYLYQLIQLNMPSIIHSYNKRLKWMCYLKGYFEYFLSTLG